MTPYVPVPSLALARVLACATSRAHERDETAALAQLRAAYVAQARAASGCTDLRVSRLECRSCRVIECPHGHQGGI